jgi:hypothetical protein
MTTRRVLGRTTAVVAVAGVLAAGACGNDDPDSAPTTASSPDIAGTTTTSSVTPGITPAGTTSPATTSPGTPAPADATGAVPEGASVEQLAAAARDVLGPTDNAIAELSRFLAVPTDIPTPRQSTVTDFSLNVRWGYYKREDAEAFGAKEPILTAGIGVYVETPATAEDVATFYEAGLAAAGYPLTGDEGDQASRTLVFGFPRSTFKWDTVRVVVSDGGNAGSTGVELYVNHRTEQSALERLDAWPGTIPAVPDLATVSATIDVTAPFVAGDPYDGVDLNVQYEVPGTKVARSLPDRVIRELHDEIVAALPSDGYRLRELGEDIDEPSCSFGYPLNSPIAVHRDGLRRAIINANLGVEVRPTRFENAIRELTFEEVVVCGLADLVADDGSPITTPPSPTVVETTMPSPPTTASPTAPVSTVGASSPDAAPPEHAPLPDGATVDEIVAAAKAVLGPTDDLDRALSPLLDLPFELPTPLGADITEFDVDMSTIGADDEVHSSDVTLRIDVAGTPEDVLTFYEAQLGASGMTRTATGQKEFIETVDFVTFESPPPDDDAVSTDEIEVQVPAGEPSGWAMIRLSARSSSDDLIRRLSSWPGEMPGMQGAELSWVGISSPYIVLAGDRAGVGLSAGYDVRGTTERAVNRSILAALPTDTYQLAERSPVSPQVTLHRRRFETVELALSETIDVFAEPGEPDELVSVSVFGQIAF